MSANFLKLLRRERNVVVPVSLLSRYKYHRPLQVTWEKPDIGWTKLNFDGSLRDKTGMSSIGDAFRNNTAYFLLGYAERIGRTTSTVVELAAVHRGLELVMENGWDNVWIEGDPKTLVEIILSRRRVNSEQVHRLVRDINLIIPQLNNCCLSHIYREGNRVVDMLARIGHESKYPRIWRNDPLTQVLQILLEDAEGMGVSRKR